MAVRRVPDDFPDVQSAANASAPGDSVEVGASVLASNAVVPIDGLSIALPGSFFSGGTFVLGAGVRSLAVSGLTLFSATGNDLGNVITGGPASGYLFGLGGDDVLLGGPGAADWMEGGTGNDTYEVDSTTAAGGQGNGNRPARFYGDQAVERPDEGWDVVWASVDFTLPAHIEGLVLTGGARTGRGNALPNTMVGTGAGDILDGLGGDDDLRGGGGDDTYIVGDRGDRVVEEAGAGTDGIRAMTDYALPANVENLFLDGTAVWGSGNDLDNRIVGNGLDNRLVGWAGSDTLTGGAGDDVFHVMATAFSRTTITDFWPGAGSNDQIAFSRDLFASREQAYAAAEQIGPDVSIARGSLATVVLQNTRLADLTLDDFLIA